MTGSQSFLYLDYAGQKLVAGVPAEASVNKNVEIGILTERLHLFDPNTTTNIIK